MKCILLFISSVWMMLLTGCAANTINEPVFDQQKRHCTCRHANYIQHTKPLAYKRDRARCYHPPQVKKTGHGSAKPKMGKSTPLLTDGFMTVVYHAEQQPVIQTAPFQVTVIQLEPGEQFTNISSGDPSRWSYAVAVSGKDDKAQQNILVKPSLPDIRTNLVITTDKRLYNLALLSAKTTTQTETDKLTRNVNFWFPEERMETRNDTVSSSVEDNVPDSGDNTRHPLNVDYQITTSGWLSRPPNWQPVRVFDDGTHTIIQFQDNVRNCDLPTLFVIHNGQKECVNYRFKSPYIIVDTLFHEATLVSGVGRSQQAILLRNLRD